MSYSRWLDSTFYTYWCQQMRKIKMMKCLFVILISINVIKSNTIECKKMVENLIAIKGKINEIVGDEDAIELQGYIKEFVKDVDKEYQ